MREKTVKEYQKIVNISDLSLIKKTLKDMGYIDATNDNFLKKVNLQDIVNSERKTVDDVCKGNLLFRMTVFEKVKGYEDYTWVWLEVLKMRKREKYKTPFSAFEDDTVVYFPDTIVLYAKINGDDTY